jgi:hypothetical protein
LVGNVWNSSWVPWKCLKCCNNGMHRATYSVDVFQNQVSSLFAVISISWAPGSWASCFVCRPIEMGRVYCISAYHSVVGHRIDNIKEKCD